MPGRSFVHRDGMSQRDRDTVDNLDDLLAQEQVDVRELRKISAVRGLVTNALRGRVWPLLLNVDVRELLPREEYLALANASNDFGSIIAADVHRSMFHFFDATQEPQRMQQLQKLERLLNAVVNFHRGNVHYYQGLHDIASILLLTLGELLAFAVLCKLATVRLRDSTQRTLEPVAELLKLQVPVLRKLDPALAQHLENRKVPCYFAISWFITWFSHDVHQLHEICRLFDFFLATHPMMPLYIGAVGMHAARTELLEEREMSELHKSLVNLRVVRFLSTDEIIVQAISLYHRWPPRRIVRGLPFRLNHCVSPFASLESNQWIVPLQTPHFQFRNPGKWFLHNIVGGIITHHGLAGASLKAVSVAGVGICAMAVVTYKLLENDMESAQLWDGIFRRL